MISAADVLLVLGAGASKPYGLPTGPELVERALRIDPRDPNDRFVAATTAVRADLPVEHIEHFQRELAAAQLDSIEFFLERRPEFMRIGKLWGGAGRRQLQARGRRHARRARGPGRGRHGVRSRA